jgi:HTH-type transcriptional regulator/antitoxin HigA
LSGSRIITRHREGNVAVRVPAEVFPPGEFLKDELEARGWTQAELAGILGRPVRLVNEIIAGKRGITPETAKELGAALGTSPEYWMNLDSAYQLWRAHRDPERFDRITREARLRERYPVREMIKRGWIENTRDWRVLETSVLRFYGKRTIDEEPRPASAAKRPSYAEPLTPIQEAWFFRVRQIAAAAPAATYSEGILRESVVKLAGLRADPDDIRRVPALLAECGVRFVVVEPLPASKIDGVCFWVDSQPIIGMSLRFDRVDNFWFVLRHEIEHVLRRDGQEEPLLDSELDGASGKSDHDLPGEEPAANAAAAEFCVPQEQLNDFVARAHPIYSEDRVVQFARSTGVHPGLVVGQLQRRLSKYNLLRKYLVPVRHLITSAALTDGFGQALPI